MSIINRISIFTLLIICILLLGTVPALGVTAGKPTASFDYSPSTPNPDDSITLDGSSSSDSDGDIVSYKWDTDGDGQYSESYDDVGDGETSSVSFDTGGTYTVGLKVEDDAGNTDTVTQQITVENPAPTASFDYSPSTPNPDDSITLDGSSSSDSDGNIVSYKWDTDGDGQYSESYDDVGDGQTSSVSFETGGTYTVGLKVEDNGGKTETVTKQITVENPAPTASFDYLPSTPNPDDSITLDGSSSSDSDGDIVSYKWDTDGDGRYSESYDDVGDGQTSSVSFETGGTYTVGLKVEDNGGKTETVTKQITVENPAPTASFFFSPYPPNPDDSITLDGSESSDSDGNIVSYKWDTDGDGRYSESYDDVGDQQTPSLSFDTGGTYTIGLKVEDNGGKIDTVTKQITVENPTPTADFSYNTSRSEGLSVTFDGSAASDPDGHITEYVWYVGGDREATGQTPTLEFDEKGTYEVSLTVTDNGAAQDSITKQVGVSRSPKAIIKEPTTPIAVNSEIRFVATSSSDPDGQIESYHWQFSDGTTEEGVTAVKEFTAPGRYTAKIVVTDDTGNTETAETTVQVKTPPNVTLSWTPTNPADDEPIQFTASANRTIESWQWDFNSDGVTDETGATVEQSFSEGGDQQVLVTAIGPDGLETSINKTVTVRNVKPKATLNWSPSVPRSKLEIGFVANSSDVITAYEWDFDSDGEIDATGPAVTHRFATVGQKTITLNVTDEHGDTASYSETMMVQQGLTFETTSKHSNAKIGDDVLIQFSVANGHPNKSLQVKLDLGLPDSGVSVSGMNGTVLTNRNDTRFFTVQPGEESTVQLRLRPDDAGSYNVSSTAIYYIGNNSSANRRTADFSPTRIDVEDPVLAVSTPVIIVAIGLVGGVLLGVFLWNRS